MSRIEKSAQREMIRSRLDAMSSDERTRRSAGLGERVGALDAYTARRGALMGYLAFGTELDVSPVFWPAWGNGRAVCVPETDWEAKSITPVLYTPAAPITVGPHGVPGLVECEPVSIKDIALVLVPGVAFDDGGGRLGRGGGFYDRFLEQLSALGGARPVFVGVCFREQMVEEVAREGHDVRMDTVIAV